MRQTIRQIGLGIRYKSHTRPGRSNPAGHPIRSGDIVTYYAEDARNNVAGFVKVLRVDNGRRTEGGITLYDETVIEVTDVQGNHYAFEPGISTFEAAQLIPEDKNSEWKPFRVSGWY